MEKAINKIVFILVLISMLFIPQYVIAKTFEVTFVWEHSGRGMDKFVFISSSIDAGPWMGEPHLVMIEDLDPPIVVNVENRWETTITVEVEDFEEVKWWVCYAETSWGSKSLTSTPVQAVLVPDKPHSIKKLNVVIPNKILVSFI